MMLVINWLILTISVLITTYILPGVTVDTIFAAVVTALVLGIINAVLRPVLLILTLPINILTLGLLTFVINALLIMLTAWVVPGFSVDSFWWALFFSVILSIINAVLSQLKKIEK